MKSDDRACGAAGSHGGLSLGAGQSQSNFTGWRLTQSAGLFVGESCLQWMPWMRCLCTSSSADGSVHKWSAVFILVYSSAQGPTGQTEDSSYMNVPQRGPAGKAGVHIGQGPVALQRTRKESKIHIMWLQNLQWEWVFLLPASLVRRGECGGGRSISEQIRRRLNCDVH